jgi:5-methyltetrahydropteroyltriglutamate--homocysteine methyltransferase
MLTLTDLPLLPTQTVGSHGVPSWLWVFRETVAEGKVGPADIQETLQDGVNLAIMDMTEAGMDIISDGELYRADFTWNFHERIHGLEPIPFERRLGYPGPDQLDSFRCVEELTVPNGYGLVPEIKHMLSRTGKPFVTGLQSPVTQAFRIAPGDVYRNKGEVAWALVPYINQELKNAAAAGGMYVQFDEPAFWTMPGGEEELTELFNACVEGVQATIGIHLCFGNFRGRPATSDRTYAKIAPFIPQMHADVIHMEFANRGMWQTELWQEYGGDKILCAGVIDVKGRSIEPVETVVARIHKLLESVRPEKLWLSSDCGFSQTARWLAVEKIKVMVKAAKIVRREIEGE